MSLVRWDHFADMDTLFNRLMPSGFARWPQQAKPKQIAVQ